MHERFKTTSVRYAWHFGYRRGECVAALISGAGLMTFVVDGTATTTRCVERCATTLLLGSCCDAMILLRNVYGCLILYYGHLTSL